jgi:hypothetical protein
MIDPTSWSTFDDVVGRGGLASTVFGPTALGLCLLAAFAISCLLAVRPVRARAAVASRR